METKEENTNNNIEENIIKNKTIENETNNTVATDKAKNNISGLYKYHKTFNDENRNEIVYTLYLKLKQ